MMIAVVLSSNIRRMIRDRVLVRKPVGIEAAGSMDLLFTDKTGTLTEGKMSVGGIVLSDGSRYDSYRALQKNAKEIAELYARSCRLNTASQWSEGAVLGGNATDRALLESGSDKRETVGSPWLREPPSVCYRICGTPTIGRGGSVPFPAVPMS